MEANPKVRVLLVDDEPDLLGPIAYWLEANGYLVTAVNNGEAAVISVQEDAPDLMFLDIQMPGGIDGLEALRRIRQFNPKLPIIMLTAAYQTKMYFTKASEAGASGFFPKTGSPQELIQIIRTTLRVHGMSKPEQPS